jgi:hypothetical protein
MKSVFRPALDNKAPRRPNLQAGHRDPWTNVGALPCNEALKAFKTNLDGLYEIEARLRLQELGPNCCIGRSSLDVTMAILGASFLVALMSAMMGYKSLAAYSFSIAIGSIAFHYLRPRKDKIVPGVVTVVRRDERTLAKRERQLPASELVPGDIVRLRAGDVVPADMRIVVCHGLTVAERDASGRLQQTEKSRQAGDCNLVHCGSTVVSGAATALVVATRTQRVGG